MVALANGIANGVNGVHGTNEVKINGHEQYKPAGDSNETMKAVRFHGKDDIRVEQIPVPKLGHGQVKVSLHIAPFVCRVANTSPAAATMGRHLRQRYVLLIVSA